MCQQSWSNRPRTHTYLAHFKVELMTLNPKEITKWGAQAHGNTWPSLRDSAALLHSLSIQKCNIFSQWSNNMVFNSSFSVLLLTLFYFLQHLKTIYMYVCVYLYRGLCIYIFMDVCVHIYPVTYLERHIPQCIDQHQLFFFFIRQGKGFKARNSYQAHSAVSFRYKLKLQIFSTLLFLWYYKMIPKSLSDTFQS